LQRYDLLVIIEREDENYSFDRSLVVFLSPHGGLMTTMEVELVSLKTRVQPLEAVVSQLIIQKPNKAQPAPAEHLGREELLAWLMEEGLILQPTPVEIGLAEEWHALPDEEKDAIRWELDHLPPGPMISDIVIESRR
jgi:hypothetical protein